MRKYFLVPAINFFVILFCHSQLLAGGVSLKFANIILENLQPGQVYSMLESKKLPFVVVNKLNSQCEIEAEVSAPSMNDVKDGYEPIPDPSWVNIVPSKFALGPAEEGKGDVLIYVPEDKKYSGRHYQVMLSAKRVPRVSEPGIVIASVVTVYLRFSIGTPGPLSIRELKKRDLLEGLNFDIAPASLYVIDVPVGKPLDLMKERELSFVLANRGKRKLDFSLTGLSPENLTGISPDYEFGGKDWIKFPKNKITIGSKKMKDIGIVLNIPDDKKHLNKRYVFGISAVITNVELPIEAHARIYVTTAEK